MKNKAWLFCLTFAVLLGVTCLYSVHPAYSKSEPGEKQERMRTGWIFYIDDKSITVDDMQFWFSSGTKFFRKDGTATGRSYFAKGLFVGLRLEGKRVITEIRELNPSVNEIPPSRTPTAPSQPIEDTPDSKDVYMEEGVWKN